MRRSRKSSRHLIQFLKSLKTTKCKQWSYNAILSVTEKNWENSYTLYVANLMRQLLMTKWCLRTVYGVTAIHFKAEDGSFEQGDDDKNTAGPSQKKLLRYIVTPAGHGASARDGFVKNVFLAYIELDAKDPFCKVWCVAWLSCVL